LGSRLCKSESRLFKLEIPSYKVKTLSPDFEIPPTRMALPTYARSNLAIGFETKLITDPIRRPNYN